MEITVLKNEFKMDEAFNVIVKKGRGVTVEHMDTVFYPYILIEYDVRYEMKRLQRYNSQALCLADMYRGDYSIARSRGKYLKMDVEDNMVMPRKMDEEHAIKEAPSYIIAEVIKGKRIIHTPDIIYNNHFQLYKAFYICQCKSGEKGDVFHIMFDSVSGAYSLLNS